MSVLSKRCPTCGAAPKRNTEQNKAYWALLHDIAEQVQVQGKVYSAEQWAEYWKQRLLGAEEISLPNGKTVLRSRSTSSLDKDEFSDYMTKIEVFASERGVIRNE